MTTKTDEDDRRRRPLVHRLLVRDPVDMFVMTLRETLSLLRSSQLSRAQQQIPGRTTAAVDTVIIIIEDKARATRFNLMKME
jgi:hypothetical protein